jgi:rhodanese-related sulfurtransferase
MCEFSEKVEKAKAAVPAVTAHEANARRAANPEILFIDPRSEADIRATTGFIPGALSVPLSELSDAADHDLPGELASRTRPIITACQGGPLGAIAAHVLQRRGYTNVQFIDGGTQGWLEAGYDTVR